MLYTCPLYLRCKNKKPEILSADFYTITAGAAFWLLIAAWLYQAAVLSKMHRLIWFFLGLCGNLAAVVVFLLLRSLIRKKCDACENYQMMKAQYCVQLTHGIVDTRFVICLFFCPNQIAHIRTHAGKHFIIEILLPVDIVYTIL